MFLINNSKIQSYESRNIDLSFVEHYDHRYNGRFGQFDFFGSSSNFYDLNRDGKKDIVVGAFMYGDQDQGGLYIILNFPHSISLTSINPTIIGIESAGVSLSGTVSASDSVTPISGVQYSLNNSDFSGDWIDCVADDGAFDSTGENFSCSVDILGLPDGEHTIYVRAYDTNRSYTAMSQYISDSFVLDTSRDEDSDAELIKTGNRVFPSFGFLLLSTLYIFGDTLRTSRLPKCVRRQD